MKQSSIKKAFRQLYTRQTFRRSFFSVAAALLLIWVAFFDSHSLFKRVSWSQEAARLTVENQRLQEEIQELGRQLQSDLPEEAIEQLARERYGMRKEGETVYPIETAP